MTRDPLTVAELRALLGELMVAGHANTRVRLAVDTKERPPDGYGLSTGPVRFVIRPDPDDPFVELH